ncbi:ATP-binding protein [Rhodopirellula bahusiensis]|uniref:ATP-binding protein n=1 Tax=Rhodopirellula bahusiensis TaxID=2014065 RepID=UPI003267D2C7
MDRKSITCSNGHHLRAAGALAGKTLPCPRCGVAVTIPWEEALTVTVEPPARDTLSDTGVMRILGDATVAPVQQPETESSEANSDSHRPCPRCEYLVSDQSTVCPKCACYLGMMPQFLRALLPKNMSA